MNRPWKIDLWSLAEEVIQRKMADMQHFQEKITPVLREQTIGYKLSVMTTQKRIPMYRGNYIYKTIINDGMTDFASVTRYLVAHGIRMEG